MQEINNTKNGKMINERLHHLQNTLMQRTLLAIIFLFFIYNSLYGQRRCDSSRVDKIFIITEIMPKSNITLDELETLLNQEINANEFSVLQGTMIYLSFIINCKGESFDYKFLRPVDEKLQDKLLTIIKTNINWKPGSQNGRLVDVQLTISIKFENNKFIVQNKKELKH